MTGAGLSRDGPRRAQHGLLPDMHLAYAAFYKCDFLLTWNCNHLTNANKRQHIRIINARLNLPTPEIVMPLELFTEADHVDE